MAKETFSFGRVLLHFFGGIPYGFFRVGYFIFTFPERMRRMRRYRAASKYITFHLLSTEPMTVPGVAALVHSLREEEARAKKPPSFFDLLGGLFEEGMSEEWKIPTVKELEAVRDDLLEDIVRSLSEHVSPPRCFVWALDDDDHIFVGYCPYTGKIKEGTPPDLLRSVVEGNVPDPCEDYFAYAVKVIPLSDVY